MMTAAPGSLSDLVSVVLPVLDEEPSIEACLRSVLAQTVRDLEVLVVDGGSRDRTRELVGSTAAGDPRVRLLDNRARIIPAGLNVGLRAARGRWLVRVDGHSTIPPDYVARVVAHLASSRSWGAVGGRKDAAADGATGRAIAAALGSRFGVGDSYYHYGTEPREVDHVPFGSYPVELLRSLGGWDERLVANEDFELDDRIRRAGHALLFDPAIRIRWRGKETLGALFAQYRRYGAGKAAVLLLRPSSVRARHLAAPTLVAGVAAAALLAVRRPAAGAALLAPYAGALVLAARRADPTLDPVARTRLPAAFAAMHLGWGLGFWEHLVRRFRSQPGA